MRPKPASTKNSQIHTGSDLFDPRSQWTAATSFQHRYLRQTILVTYCYALTWQRLKARWVLNRAQ